jgi:hypothetical protein
MTPANSWTQIRFEDRALIVVASHPADLLTDLRTAGGLESDA